MRWEEDQGEESAWGWSLGPVGSFAGVGVAAFCVAGVGPAEPAVVDHGCEVVEPGGWYVPGWVVRGEKRPGRRPGREPRPGRR